MLWLLTFHDPPYDYNSYLYISLKVLYPLSNIMTRNNVGSHLFESRVTLKSLNFGVTSVLTHVQPLDVSGTHLDQLSSPKNHYFDTLCKHVALMVQKLECDQFLTHGMCTDTCRTRVRPRDWSVTNVGYYIILFKPLTCLCK